MELNTFLNPQHYAELKSFHVGVPFDEAEIFLLEKRSSDSDFTKLSDIRPRLKIDDIFCGDNRTRVVFSAGEGNVFYCVSVANCGDYCERIIFKLSYKEE